MLPGTAPPQNAKAHWTPHHGYLWACGVSDEQTGVNFRSVFPDPGGRQALQFMWVGDHLITDLHELGQAALTHMASRPAANQWRSRPYDPMGPASTLIPDGLWKGERRASTLFLECMGSMRWAVHRTEFDAVFQPPIFQEFLAEVGWDFRATRSVAIRTRGSGGSRESGEQHGCRNIAVFRRVCELAVCRPQCTRPASRVSKVSRFGIFNRPFQKPLVRKHNTWPWFLTQDFP